MLLCIFLVAFPRGGDAPSNVVDLVMPVSQSVKSPLCSKP